MFAKIEARVELTGPGDRRPRRGVRLRRHGDRRPLHRRAAAVHARLRDRRQGSAGGGEDHPRAHLALIAVGRWAGMITVLSAQKPTADIVPTESRDLIEQVRPALQHEAPCRTRSWAPDRARSSRPTPPTSALGQPGVGYYVGDAGSAEDPQLLHLPQAGRRVGRAGGVTQLRRRTQDAGLMGTFDDDVELFWGKKRTGRRHHRYYR
jgi:hypothetical protein